MFMQFHRMGKPGRSGLWFGAFLFFFGLTILIVPELLVALVASFFMITGLGIFFSSWQVSKHFRFGERNMGSSSDQGSIDAFFEQR